MHYSSINDLNSWPQHLPLPGEELASEEQGAKSTIKNIL